MEVRLISLGIVAVTELFLVFSSIFSTLPLGDESIAIVDTFQVRKSSRVGTREAGMRLKRRRRHSLMLAGARVFPFVFFVYASKRGMRSRTSAMSI